MSAQDDARWRPPAQLVLSPPTKPYGALATQPAALLSKTSLLPHAAGEVTNHFLLLLLL
eukprot:CAMPEP_0206526170 /NCGR_PEP_ID=MMETSP0325_2-20121206/557_1 /ASSEMBLY_ACC=CAM_ASM_000347 /TAXON_ID=2866 /ORGANISM="Crypthecodinium cohnii, Strain Seligo" /LENGTH=58 /DNA_ID=CAMNT_0054021265 /DNA_START=300 /DNA_END=473 /DNA_ORIENTATION=-